MKRHSFKLTIGTALIAVLLTTSGISPVQVSAIDTSSTKYQYEVESKKGDIEHQGEDTTVSVDASMLPANDEMLNEYLQSFVTQQKPISGRRVAKKRGSNLTGNDIYVYNSILSQINDLVAGNRTNTNFTIDVSPMVDGKMVYTDADLDNKPIYDGSKTGNDAWNSDAINEVTSKISFNSQKVLDALRADYPQLLFWKERGADKYNSPGVSLSWNPTDGGKITLPSTQNFYMSVDPTYRADSSDKYSVNSGKITAAKNAVSTAQNVVMQYAPLSDYDKLVAYNKWIDDNNAYNDSAANSDPSTIGIDPWELIYVFDNDPSTKTVCEGYAKAFKYLCDLSTFNGDVRVYTVTGTMSGGTGAGAHMWDIVHMPDGNKYLVDPTNNDDGTIGQFEKSSGYGLMLAGYTTLNNDTYTVGRFDYSGGSVNYTYDNDTKQMYSSEELSLAPFNYAEAILNPSEITLQEGNNLKGFQARIKTSGTELGPDNNYVSWLSSDSNISYYDTQGASGIVGKSQGETELTFSSKGSH